MPFVMRLGDSRTLATWTVDLRLGRSRWWAYAVRVMRTRGTNRRGVRFVDIANDPPDGRGEECSL